MVNPLHPRAAGDAWVVEGEVVRRCHVRTPAGSDGLVEIAVSAKAGATRRVHVGDVYPTHGTAIAELARRRKAWRQALGMRS